MQGSSRQPRLSEYGRFRTSFSGRLEAEDHQPNESLRARSNGPPELRTTVTASLFPGGRRGGRSGAFGRGRSWQPAQNNPRISASAQAGLRLPAWNQRGGKRLHSEEHAPAAKKHKSQHEAGLGNNTLPQQWPSSSGSYSEPTYAVPSHTITEHTPIQYRSGASAPTTPHNPYPTPAPSSFWMSPHVSTLYQAGLTPVPEPRDRSSKEVSSSRLPEPQSNLGYGGPSSSSLLSSVLPSVPPSARVLSHKTSLSSVDAAQTPITSTPQTPLVKEEPPEVIDIDDLPRRKLITTRCERYVWPANCHKSVLGWQKNRKTFMREKAKLLENKRVSVHKRIFRDDGMVLEWISHAPLWDDTLEPEVERKSIASAINSSASPAQRRLVESIRNGTPSSRSSLSPTRPHQSLAPSQTQESPQPRIVRPSQRDLPAPKLPKRKFKPVQGPSSLRPAQAVIDPSVSDSPLPLPQETSAEATSASQETWNEPSGNHELGWLPPLPPPRGRRRPRQDQPKRRPSRDTAGTLIPVQPSYYEQTVGHEAQEENLARAEAYIIRYMNHFDEDRSILHGAYTTNATFSCSIHETTLARGPVGMAELFCHQRSPVSNHGRQHLELAQGRARVVDSLLSLGPYALEYDDAKRPMYDVVTRTIPHCNGTRDVVLLTMHGDVTHTSTDLGEGHVLSVDQSFALCRPEDLEEWEKVDVRVGDDIWGLTVSGLGGKEGEEPWPLLALSHQMVVRDLPTMFSPKLSEEGWISDILSSS